MHFDKKMDVPFSILHIIVCSLREDLIFHKRDNNKTVLVSSQCHELYKLGFVCFSLVSIEIAKNDNFHIFF